MINDLMDSKKTDFQNGGESCSPHDVAEEPDGKVESETDEDGSQISPIQTFKVNHNNRK